MMNNTIRLLATVAVLTGVGVIASGCNTTAGAGKDIKSVGGTIEKTAEKAKK
jgi:predicted small secreted protein